MKKLFAFLATYSVLILFVVLEIISFSLIVNNDGYQQSVFFSSGNTVVASLYNINNSVNEYFRLKKSNEDLARENLILQNRLLETETQIAALENYLSVGKTLIPSTNKPELRYISAKVINNSTNKQLNYITLNKGSKDGIRPDMGVVNQDGVVGVIAKVSENYAVVIPVLNANIHINGKFASNQYFGFVNWDGRDYRYAKFNDIARHVNFTAGDSIITTGYTLSFPEGIMIGTVDNFDIKKSDAYFNIKVKLAVNFRTLSHVKVIDYINYQERTAVENSMNQ